MGAAAAAAEGDRLRRGSVLLTLLVHQIYDLSNPQQNFNVLLFLNKINLVSYLFRQWYVNMNSNFKITLYIYFSQIIIAYY